MLLQNGDQLDYAATEPGLLRYKIDHANVYVPDGGHNVTDPSLPQQLWPYRTDRIEADGPPTAGVWRTHQTVYARPNSTSVVRGWKCVVAGKPGSWVPLDAEGGEILQLELVPALERLARLRGAGALTEDEFTRAKSVAIAQHVLTTSNLRYTM